MRGTVGPVFLVCCELTRLAWSKWLLIVAHYSPHVLFDGSQKGCNIVVPYFRLVAFPRLQFQQRDRCLRERWTAGASFDSVQQHGQGGRYPQRGMIAYL